MNLLNSARRYHRMGFSVIPCRADKRPDGQWQQYTVKRARLSEVESWIEKGINSIGLIGGSVSDNVVFIDLDGIPAIKMFAKQFPSLCENTLSVLTGSQKGIHLYVRVPDIPQNINVRVPNVGGFEIRGNGQYVIAPPSIHPSGNEYRVYRDRPIIEAITLSQVYDWMQSLRTKQWENPSDTPISDFSPNLGSSTVRRKQNYMRKVINDRLSKIESAGAGSRNNVLFKSVLILANFCAGGELDWLEVEPMIYASAMRVFHDSERMEVHRTINSAYRIGIKYKRTIP